MFLKVNRSKYLSAGQQDEVYKAASVILNELLGKKINRKVEVLISVKGAGFEKDVDGFCHVSEEYDNGSPREFEVEIRGDKGIDKTIQYLAHELVHVWQIMTGRFTTEQYNKHDDYWSAPWEIEARNMEMRLYELYLNS